MSDTTSDGGASWLDYLQPASWRGLPFSVLQSEIHAGRKTAIHNYPFRDVVWVEDLGKKGRQYTFRAFVVGDDCYQQEQALLDAVEQEGPGTLVHPSLGERTVSLVDYSSGINFERGRSVEFNFVFIEGVPPLYPDSSTSPQDDVDDAADDADTASSDDFVTSISDAVGVVEDVSGAAEMVILTVEGYVAIATGLIGDVSAIAFCLVGIVPPVGYYFGRYANGSLASYGGPSGPILTVAAQTSAALSAAITARTAITVAGFNAALSAINLTSTASLATAVQAVSAAVQAAAVDPADQVRLAVTLAGFVPTVPPNAGSAGAALVAVQAAVASMCRRSALTTLARAVALYQPTSYQAAIALLTQVTGLLDGEILIAADAFDSESYSALRRMRTSVVNYLLSLAASLPSLVTITTAVPMPALAEAYALYGDASRSDELVQRADPINPLFLPTTFVALSQ